MKAATVVITTRNRKDELRNAISSALAQIGRPDVLVIDDGSTDDTSLMVRQEFPRVRLDRSNQSQGYIIQRNRAALLTETPYIFSLDDDAVFSAPDIVASTLDLFDHSRVGAVAIPFVDINRNQEIQQQAPSRSGVYASYTYIGTAHAVRRDLFLESGRYREVLVHQGEEEDFCTRLLAAGYVTRAGLSAPIHHFESLQRNWDRMDFYGARNKILYAWHNVPWPSFGGHMVATTIQTLMHDLRPRRFKTRLHGVLSAYVLLMTQSCQRLPVPSSVYRLSRLLKKLGAVRLEQIEPRLPAISY